MTPKRPNIIFCHVDQLNHESLSGLGCADVFTPNLDRIYRDGKGFLRAQSSNPVCCPARTCWYTGRMSSENGILTNGPGLVQDLPDLGQWMAPRGYDCFYAGKWHVPQRDVGKSFQVIYPDYGLGERNDNDLAQVIESFLEVHRSEKPFFLNIGLLNPHDCCWVDAWPKDLATKLGIEKHLDLPPLPPDYDPQKPFISPTPECIAGQWTPAEIALYRYYYYRQTERVDYAIGRIYDAVRNMPDVANTLFIFSSDHGEMMAHRNRFKKSMLYDPSLRVPLVFVQPGKIKAGTRDTEHIIGGVDVTATILDYAGIEPLPHASFARSIRPLLEGDGTKADWHPYVPAESLRLADFQQCFRAGKYKSIYNLKAKTLELYDTDTDPFEQKNLADEKEFAAVRREHDGYQKDYTSKLIPSQNFLNKLKNWDVPLGIIEPIN